MLNLNQPFNPIVLYQGTLEQAQFIYDSAQYGRQLSDGRCMWTVIPEQAEEIVQEYFYSLNEQDLLKKEAALLPNVVIKPVKEELFSIEGFLMYQTVHLKKDPKVTMLSIDKALALIEKEPVQSIM